jgi:hypothetical protein
MRRLWQVLLHMAEGAKGESLSCEECFMLLDCVSDLLADGYAVDEVMPLADKYLQRCPQCQQEYLQDLYELIAGQQERLPQDREPALPVSPIGAAQPAGGE